MNRHCTAEHTNFTR